MAKQTNPLLIIGIIVAFIVLAKYGGFMGAFREYSSCYTSSQQDCNFWDSRAEGSGFDGQYYIRGKESTCSGNDLKVCISTTSSECYNRGYDIFIDSCDLGGGECDEWVYGCSGTEGIFETQCSDYNGVVYHCPPSQTCVGRQQTYSQEPSQSTVVQDLCYATSCDEWVYGCSGTNQIFETECSEYNGIVTSCPQNKECTGNQKTYSNQPPYSTVQSDICHDVQCTPNWQCGGWSACSGGQQQRTCYDLNTCQSSYIEYQACSSQCQYDTDCGRDGWVGTNYCSGNNVYNTWRQYICSGGVCSSQERPTLKETCTSGCSNGVCNGQTCTEQQGGSDCCMALSELMIYANKWISKQIQLPDLMTGANNWINRNKSVC